MSDFAFSQPSAISQINFWLQKTIPSPSYRTTHQQIAAHFEAFCQMLSPLCDAGSTYPAREELGFAHNVLDYIQRRLKAGDGLEIEIPDINRTHLLESLCAQVVSIVSIAHSLEMDMESALKEVADSNDSRLGPDGNPIFNTQMKLVNGPGYFTPDLGKFT